jgi:hypothetical protein
MYASIMGVIALHVPGASWSAQPSMRILVVIVLMAAAYFLFRQYREYLNTRFNRHRRK